MISTSFTMLPRNATRLTEQGNVTRVTIAHPLRGHQEEFRAVIAVMEAVARTATTQGRDQPGRLQL